MKPIARPRGTFVVSWSQTEIDGYPEGPETALRQGATWTWRGEAVRLDGASGMATPPAMEGDEEARRQVAREARRLIERAMLADDRRTPFVREAEPVDRRFRLTDGAHVWTATLIDVAEIARPLILFTGSLPPDGMALFVEEGVTAAAAPSLLRPAVEGVVCFTPGTMLETPEGRRPVEALAAGDRVTTKDAGAQEVLWVGQRNVSGARLYAMPDLRPVRIRRGAIGGERPDADLVVSPDHRVLVEGAAALALWGEREVLVAARDLIDDFGILRDRSARSVSYIHLMLPAHHVLLANGVETESFHPGATALDEIDEMQLRRLFDVMPEIENDPAAYGPMTRRVLSPAEAAVLAGERRH